MKNCAALLNQWLKIKMEFPNLIVLFHKNKSYCLSFQQARLPPQNTHLSCISYTQKKGSLGHGPSTQIITRLLPQTSRSLQHRNGRCAPSEHGHSLLPVPQLREHHAQLLSAELPLKSGPHPTRDVHPKGSQSNSPSALSEHLVLLLLGGNDFSSHGNLFLFSLGFA